MVRYNISLTPLDMSSLAPDIIVDLCAHVLEEVTDNIICSSINMDTYTSHTFEIHKEWLKWHLKTLKQFVCPTAKDDHFVTEMFSAEITTLVVGSNRLFVTQVVPEFEWITQLPLTIAVDLLLQLLKGSVETLTKLSTDLPPILYNESFTTRWKTACDFYQETITASHCCHKSNKIHLIKCVIDVDNLSRKDEDCSSSTAPTIHLPDEVEPHSQVKEDNSSTSICPVTVRKYTPPCVILLPPRKRKSQN